ncbi:hypothetical protein NX059_011484 [Plenodomus lindquistii]|nr:hypothetical protein NX059_011484 [Plenodomus lindquistii]
MSGPLTATSFFSFGPNDSFIAKSFAGLKYANLPPSLTSLLTTNPPPTINWATLGSTPDSWILSLSPSPSSPPTLHHGPSIPARLQQILNKTWHSPHLRCFFGPNASFMLWHPDLIRWSGLPEGLEDAIQSWLTPSGWRVGPPRIVSWGEGGAFFAMSEYGDVAYGFGSRDEDGEAEWGVWEETVEEWKAERGFTWSGVAFIAMDVASVDQFIVVRRDGTWAGSIDDVNEDALEEFALNFWARARKVKRDEGEPASSSGAQDDRDKSASTTASNGQNETPNHVLYSTWASQTSSLFASATLFLAPNPATTTTYPTPKPKTPRKLQVRTPSTSTSTSTPSAPPTLLQSFPYPPLPSPPCILAPCVLLKLEPNGLRACQHDVERLLRSSGSYSYEWLRQERLRWHPDRFGRLCAEGWREEGKKMGGEMFKVLSALMEDVRAAERGDDGGNGRG